MEFPFLTPDEAFLRAADADPRLNRESFLEQVRGHIGSGSLLASGFRFRETRSSAMIMPTPPFELVSFPMVNKFASRERVEIPPLAMADYSGPGYDGRIVRDTGADIDGWEDVRLRADDVDRLWPRAAARAIASNAGQIKRRVDGNIEAGTCFDVIAESQAKKEGSNKPKPTNQAVRQWMRDRVASWPNDKSTPSEGDDLDAVQQHFAPGLSRDEFRNVRKSETPRGWRKQGPRKPWGQVRD